MSQSVQMTWILGENHYFRPSDPISILAFLFLFKLAGDTNVTHKEAGM